MASIIFEYAESKIRLPKDLDRPFSWNALRHLGQ